MSDTEALAGELDEADSGPAPDPAEGSPWWAHTWLWLACLSIVVLAVVLVLLLGSASGAGAAGDCGGG
jgi:hypothetical protein